MMTQTRWLHRYDLGGEKSLAFVFLTRKEDEDMHQLTTVCKIQNKLQFQVHHGGYL